MKSIPSFFKLLSRFVDWAAHGFFFDFADGALSPFDASVVTRESACSRSNEALNSDRFEKLADEDG